MPRFILPVNGQRTQNFGGNAEYYAKYGQLGHNGWDIAVNTGTPVVASADGTIYFEGWGQNSSWVGAVAGIAVLINHSDSFTGYAHLSSTIVSKGQRVSQGQVIGYSGATGGVTGPHLHFETFPGSPNWKNGYAGRIDPANYINQSVSSGEEEVITRNDIVQLRVVNSEVKGWDRNKTHTGGYDEQEGNAWVGQTWQKFVQQAWDEGASYRATKDAWLQAFNERGALVQQLNVAIAERAGMQASLDVSNEKLTETTNKITELDTQIVSLNGSIAKKDAEIEKLNLNTKDLNSYTVGELVSAIWNKFKGVK